MKNRPFFLLLITFLVFVIVVIIGLHIHLAPPLSASIRVVAAENFYADIAKQIGGSHIQVISILSNPNTDPHEYESSVQDAESISNAHIVIENGAGYDTWMDKLLSASPNQARALITAADIAPNTLQDNPHVWYGINNMQSIAIKIAGTLEAIDPTNKIDYEANLETFTHSLIPLTQKMDNIKAKFMNTPVALTETIYLYQTGPEGLQVLTPFSFEKAIAEGNDPSADDVAMANTEITNRQAKVLIYNAQTITPITTNLENEAKKESIPVVPVTETMPKNQHYQDWMMSELTNLENALALTK